MDGTFKDYVKQHLEKSGRKISYLEEQLGTTRKTYVKKIEDPKLFNVYEILILAKVLEVDKSDLFLIISNT